jgi:hypothetical protein
LIDEKATKPLAAFGFLTIQESQEHGLFGGYLVLSPQGRPLEFRCSTPIVPSRAQVILYGPTLRSYLLSEVVGQTLVESAEVPVAAIFINERDMLPLAAVRKEDVLYVAPLDEGQGIDAPKREHISQFGSWTIETYAGVWRSDEQLRELIAPLAAQVDLCEPFERILAALAEAQLTSHDAEEVRDERAAA